MELTTDALVWLGMIAVLAGFIDSVAGGGGLIAIPAMLLFQIPPINAIATNKLQGSFGTATAAITMLKKGKVTLPNPWHYFVIALLGGIAGAFLVYQFNAGTLEVLVPLVLTAVALYFLLSGESSDSERTPTVSDFLYKNIVVPVIGIYDGFFGPGAGSFYAMTGVALRGQKLITATANAKVLNFGSNVASLVVFIIGGSVFWTVGAVMIVGQMVGAYLGSLAVISVGGRLIRPVIVTVCLGMIARYAWQKGYWIW